MFRVLSMLIIIVNATNDVLEKAETEILDIGMFKLQLLLIDSVDQAFLPFLPFDSI